MPCFYDFVDLDLLAGSVTLNKSFFYGLFFSVCKIRDWNGGRDR